MEKLSKIPSSLYTLVTVMAIRQRYAQRNIGIPSEYKHYLLSPISHTCFLFRNMFLTYIFSATDSPQGFP